MSVGAKGRDILLQFLVEAVIISVTGGLIGVLSGVIISSLIAFLGSWKVSISVFSIILSFAVCCFVGIFFGWYPAKKASRLNPIEAIRYE